MLVLIFVINCSSTRECKSKVILEKKQIFFQKYNKNNEVALRSHLIISLYILFIL